jgi:flotillin
VVAEMVKPAEKIDSIRINQLNGLGPGQGGGQGPQAPVNQALDAILGMAVQLPALKKLGDEIGVTFDKGVASLSDSATDSTPETPKRD